MPVTTTTAYPHLLEVGGYFAHRKPSAEVVAAAARNLGWPSSTPAAGEVAARIRAARQAVANPQLVSLGTHPGLDEAVAVCYAAYGLRDDELTERSGGATWARRQPAGTEAARLESSYVTFLIHRADLDGGVSGCRVTARWWD
jgi:hypothetical protein